jgi:glutamine amidotransferase
MIGILDFGMGNIRSVRNAVYQNGFDPVLIHSAANFDDISHLILPGVGNFSAAIPEIENRHLRQLVINFVASGRPLLGTCLGMQLLMTIGEEGGSYSGLDLIPGKVTRLKCDGLRVPHVGWNILNMEQAHPIFQNIKSGRDFYFVHSYEVFCEHSSDVLASTEYGGVVTAVIGRNNVVGVQFHPEKSQLNGLRLIGNFCRWDGKC